MWRSLARRLQAEEVDVAVLLQLPLVDTIVVDVLLVPREQEESRKRVHEEEGEVEGRGGGSATHPEATGRQTSCCCCCQRGGKEGRDLLAGCGYLPQ